MNPGNTSKTVIVLEFQASLTKWTSPFGKFIGLTKADRSNKFGNSSIKHCGIVGYYTSASRGVLNHFVNPRIGLPKVTKKHNLPVKTAPFSPRVILVCLSRGPQPKKPRRPYTTGLKPHKQKTPTPKTQSRTTTPNPQTTANEQI